MVVASQPRQTKLTCLLCTATTARWFTRSQQKKTSGTQVLSGLASGPSMQTWCKCADHCRCVPGVPVTTARAPPRSCRCPRSARRSAARDLNSYGPCRAGGHGTASLLLLRQLGGRRETTHSIFLIKTNESMKNEAF